MMTAASGGTFRTLLSMRARIATTLFTSQAYYHLVETLFFALIIYLALTRAYKPWARNTTPALSAAERTARISSWRPAPLSDPPEGSSTSTSQSASLNDSDEGIDIEIESGGAGPVVCVRGFGDAINVATHNFLGLLKDRRIEKAALEVMSEYGCGACGPRGFYGTTDVHLECEAALARFYTTPNAILYSFGAATANSTIPAFVKRGDLLVVDDTIGYPLRLGARLSRAQVVPFRHNDMVDLRRVLARVVAENPKRARTQRRLIVVEAISANFGDVCPLDEVVALKDMFGFRLLVDESLSLGVLGRSGHGALEEFKVSRDQVEIATADLGNAVASVGGVCVGADDVVDHQRLSGAGYCFSASQPPFLAKAATAAIAVIEQDGNALVSALRDRIKVFHHSVGISDLRSAGWRLDGDMRSPVIHFRRIRNDLSGSAFTDIQRTCLLNSVLVALPRHAPDDPINISNSSGTLLHIRVSLSTALSHEQVDKAATVVRAALLNAARKVEDCKV